MSSPVSLFDPAGPLTGAETFGFVQDLGNVRATLNDLLAFFGGGGTFNAFGNAIADEDIPAGALVTLSESGGNAHMELADASDPAKPAHAFAPAHVAITDIGMWQRRGIIPGTDGEAFATVLFLSETAGEFTDTAPVTAGSILQNIGMVLPGVGVDFNPQQELSL